MTPAAYIVLGLASNTVAIVAGFLIGHRAGVQRERARSWRRASSMIELRRAIERKAGTR